MGDSHSQGSGLRQRRTSTAAETLITTAKEVEHAIEDTLLMLWDELPSWRRDNAYIKSGYRQSRASYMHSVRSLFYLHNESVNIWSHLLGAVSAAAASLYLYGVIRPRYASARFDDVVVFGCFFGGAVLCLGMSATFHMLLNHSEAVMTWGNKLDYTGIIALIVGSYVPALYYGFFCKPTLLSIYLSLVRNTASRLIHADHPDLHSRYWLRPRLLGRQVSPSRAQGVPSCHVCCARLVRCRSHHPRRQYLRLPRT
jgi:adiponectin receptor